MIQLNAVYKRQILDSKIYYVENKRIGKDIPCKYQPNTARVAILISDKITVKTKIFTRHKENTLGHKASLNNLISENLNHIGCVSLTAVEIARCELQNENQKSPQGFAN